MMSDNKKLNEEQLKNVAGGTAYDPDEEWVVSAKLEKEPICGSDYEKDGEWVIKTETKKP